MLWNIIKGMPYFWFVAFLILSFWLKKYSEGLYFIPPHPTLTLPLCASGFRSKLFSAAKKQIRDFAFIWSLLSRKWREPKKGQFLETEKKFFSLWGRKQKQKKHSSENQSNWLESIFTKLFWRKLLVKMN